MPIPLYTVDAYRLTPRDAAEAFAREWFAEPREVAWFGPGGDFGLVDGIVTYRVVWVPATADLPARYEVMRLDD